ncbi:MAG: type II toxin-antitoxin system RelE/ParE family toxin [Candidatus Hydrogenedentes bacterium]|nr:type II toxin-antitoxin system RelE/ParE family toxin [Candidatus Hydrogenedentota bacterium]
MNLFIRSPSAGSDVEGIFDFISRDNPDAAIQWATALQAKFEFLTSHPNVGRPFPSVGPGVRAIPFGRYLSFFKFEHEALKILRVIHSARNIKQAWDEV